MSMSIAINEVAGDRNLATAKDVVTELRKRLGDHLVFHSTRTDAAAAAEVDQLILTSVRHGGGSARQIADDTDIPGFSVGWEPGWWHLTGRLYRDPSRAGRPDEHSPVVLHHRSREAIIYGPIVSELAAVILGNVLRYQALSNRRP